MIQSYIAGGSRLNNGGGGLVERSLCMLVSDEGREGKDVVFVP